MMKRRERSKKNKRKRLRPRGRASSKYFTAGSEAALGTWRSRWEEQEIESFGVLEKV
jgi:hypothetical protein